MPAEGILPHFISDEGKGLCDLDESGDGYLNTGATGIQDAHTAGWTSRRGERVWVMIHGAPIKLAQTNPNHSCCLSLKTLKTKK